MIKLTVPGNPPSDNHLYGHRAFGKRVIKYMTARGKEYKKQAQMLAQGYTSTDEPIFMKIHLYFGDKRKRDLHGCLKVLIDAFEKLIYDNDNQIIKLELYKSYDKENPRAEIEINTIGEIYGN